MKRTVGFRFSEEVLEKLSELAEGSTRTAVLEGLVLEASRGSAVVETVTKPPIKTSAEAKQYIEKVERPTVHVEPGKLSRTIPKPDWKKDAS